MRPFASLLAAATLVACAPDAAAPFEVALTVDPDPPTAGTDVVLGCHVTRADDGSDVVGATVAVEPWMSAHGHGLGSTPTVEEIGDGLYDTTVVFPMAGAWDIRVTVTDGADSDDVTLPLDVE